MREIKFRAWDIRNSMSDDVPVHEMVYIKPFDGELDGKFLIKEGGYIGSYTKLMQFTGLLDKSGKEIYEGDIVRKVRIKEDVGSVKWGYSEWIVCLPKWEETFHLFGFPNDHGTPRIEVIGNIYENPELLK